MNFLELFTSQLGSNNVDAIGNAVGSDKNQTLAALGQFVPLMVSALARNTSTPEGANALSGALERDHDGSILQNIVGLLGNPASGNGDGILGHVFGGKRGAAEQAVSQSSGMDLASTARLFSMVAPLVLGMIGEKKRQDGFGADVLSSMLNGFSQHHESDQFGQSNSGRGDLLATISNLANGSDGNSQPQGDGGGLGGFIKGVLDRDHDGSVLDDVGGMLSGLLSGNK